MEETKHETSSDNDNDDIGAREQQNSAPNAFQMADLRVVLNFAQGESEQRNVDSSAVFSVATLIAALLAQIAERDAEIAEREAQIADLKELVNGTYYTTMGVLWDTGSMIRFKDEN